MTLPEFVSKVVECAEEEDLFGLEELRETANGWMMSEDDRQPFVQLVDFHINLLNELDRN